MTRDAGFDLRYDAWCGWLLGALGLGRRCSRVVVGEDAVTVRMGWGFAARIPRDRIATVTATERPFVGWGVHGWGGRWLVNGSLQGLVAVGVEPPVRARVLFVPVRLRTLYVSLADPEAFRAALATPTGQVRW